MDRLSLRALFAWLAFFACFSFALGASAEGPALKRALLLNSYSLDYSWTENIVTGVRGVLGSRDDVELDIEFMGTKKAWDETLAAQLSNALKTRYSKTKLDVIITSDDDALNFLLARRAELFPGVPVVFCGLNNFTDERIRGQGEITGVAEDITVDTNFEFILAHHPGVRRFLVVHDGSSTGKAVAAKLRKAAPGYAGRVELEFLTDVTFEELAPRLAAVQPDTVVLWGVFFRDKNGRYLSAPRSTRLVALSSPVPVYSFWDFATTGGVVGGNVVSGLHQGETAAHMALQVLDGVRTSSIPVRRESPNVFLFDYAPLQRFGITISSLPKGSMVRNRPTSFYESHKEIVWAVLAALAGESTAILALLVILGRVRRRSEQHILELNRRLQGVLDSMQEALLVCDRTGALSEIHSRAADRHFGSVPPGTMIWDYLFADNQNARRSFVLAFEQLTEGVLPDELLLEQMPRALLREDRVFAIAYRRVERDGVPAELVVLLEDVTLRQAQERTERFYRALPNIVGHMLRDREGFLDFVSETERLLGDLSSSSESIYQRRILHTLKGNTAVYGFTHVSELCHKLEDQVSLDPEQLNVENTTKISKEWQTACEELEVFLTSDDEMYVRIRRHEYDALVERLTRRQDYSDILSFVHAFRRPLVAQAVGPYLATAERLAERLHKKVEIAMENGDTRLPSSALRGFCQTLVHVVRNAIDHGLEGPTERLRQGKPEVGRLTLSAEVKDTLFTLIIQDDGRGIDWDHLRERARALGLPEAMDDEDLLFADGLSTQKDATDISGRGLGLGAVRHACEALGGTVIVSSVKGRGTSFEFVFPTAPGSPLSRYTSLSAPRTSLSSPSPNASLPIGISAAPEPLW